MATMGNKPESRPRNALEAFLSSARGCESVEILEDLHGKTLLALQAAGLDEVSCDRIRDGLDKIRLLVARMAWYFEPGYSVIEQRRLGKPDAEVVRARLMDAIDLLKPYAVLLGDARHRPAGYSAGDLQSEAEIGTDLWQHILRLSGLKRTRRGDQNRRFSAVDVRRLADAAERKATPKARRAATRWRRLIGEAVADGE